MSWRVTGRIPRGPRPSVRSAVADPDSTAGLVFLGALRRAGIAVRARVAVVPVSSLATARHATLLRLESRRRRRWSPCRRSLNVETEALLRHLDPAPRASPPPRRCGASYAMLSETGIDTLDLSSWNGSVSPAESRHAARVRAVARVPDRDSTLGGIFRESLALPGGGNAPEALSVARPEGAPACQVGNP